MARFNRLEAIPGGGGVPPEPDWSLIWRGKRQQASCRLASEHWVGIINEMREAGTLSCGNGHAIKRLVEHRVSYDMAMQKVATQGAVIRSTRSKGQVANPWWRVARQAEEVIRLLEAELGIAPVRRGKAKKVEKRANPTRAAEAYLRAANRG
jgi:phage terminase small subunit